MRIESIEYEELHTGWTLRETQFNPGVTLLVGLSGAGKTRILRALQILQEIATSDGKRLPGAIRWCLEFLLADGVKCIWTGETDYDGSDPDQPSWIVSESLVVENVEVFRRDGDTFSFRGNPAPPLSHQLGGFRLFAVDSDLARITREFRDLIFLHHGQPIVPLHSTTWTTTEYQEYKEKFGDLNRLRTSDLNLEKRIYVTSLFHPELFQQIKSSFVGAFPYVEGVTVFQYQINDTIFLDLSVNEKHIDESLWLSDLSSGMLNTFLLIAYCYLWPDGTVILIDEFESSMGMNCLDDATDLILETSRRMQFILTSHHPYVINNIRPECWKIVSRDGGIVTTRDAQDIGIGTSRHTSFTQLMNSKAYTEGILSE